MLVFYNLIVKNDGLLIVTIYLFKNCINEIFATQS